MVTYSVSCGIGVLEEGVQVKLRRVTVDKWPTTNLSTQPPQLTTLGSQPRSLQTESILAINLIPSRAYFANLPELREVR